MKYKGSLQGRWTGRLVDVQGWEGTLTLDLKQERRSSEVTGFFDITIGSEHAPLHQRGALRGKVENDHLQLEFAAGKEQSVTIRLDGQVQPLKTGGVGLCATYEVAAKFFSPLQGGVVSASLGRPLSAVSIGPETLIEAVIDGDKPTRQTRRRSS